MPSESFSVVVDAGVDEQLVQLDILPLMGMIRTSVAVLAIACLSPVQILRIKR